LFAADATLVINPTLYRQLPFQPERDFAPISRIAVVPLVLVANPGVKADTLPELVELGRGNDARLDYGSAGAGSMGHLVGERLNRATRMKMTHIPYKSGAQAIADVVSGQIPLLITGLAVADPFLKNGKLKAIAVTSGQRFPGAPAVPTIAEGGVKDFDSPSWYGLLAPAGTPAPVLEKIHDALAAALQTEDMKARMVELGAWPVVDSRAAFTELIKQDTARWSQIIKAAGITVQ
jgi:tripartite-type tricarboxylate transporter receptor subunit TctC